MKKICLILIVIILFIPNICLANIIKNIDIEVYLDTNGDAHIKEIWNVIADKNTEFYKAYHNLGSSKISNFKVNMNTTQFENISWDIDKSFEEKKYKSGYNYTDDGIELCFGISEYGNNIYNLSYDIENFIVTTNDNYQMLYWTLVMPSSDKIENANIKIYSDLKYSNNLLIKGYGKYGAPIYIDNGSIIMTSNGSLDSEEYLTLLVKFPANTFNSEITLDKNFDEYLDMAESGATSYNEEEPLLAIILISIFSFLITFLSVLGAIKSIRYGTYKLDFGKTKNKVKEKGYYRDIPYKKEELSRAYWIACQYNLILRQTDYLGAVLLKWLKLGNITIQKENNAIILNNSTNLNKEELNLYQMISESARDGKLEKKEFERWCNTNNSKILKWFNNIIDAETEKLISEGKLTKETNKKKCIVHSSMMEEAKKIKGLKNFLNDFSNIKDRSAIEVNIWEEYLMYAMIFGIAKKVMKDFKKLYPEIITESTYNDINFIYLISYNSMNTATYSGSHSSGGGGGGSFGGGGSMGSR